MKETPEQETTVYPHSTVKQIVPSSLFSTQFLRLTESLMFRQLRDRRYFSLPIALP